ncbi:DUF421 domain-containing protein [Sutcliffiella horikoshii]|uniref:DUF421 domain-containing protein n=1 Tax=Sutcliffiella horikoshii TaxID=79883 RepID=A0A5D4SM94_9BACI|nr:DUF421 domain-containing protein [Sutcliffiella horikoshii]TYS64545.1 DUF421 domain-containing protein [Sutcliffiella horikoshii]
MPEHFEVVLRSILAFSTLLIGTRILGKQTISQMTLFDFIAGISLGAITANLAFNLTIDIHHFLISLFMFIFILFVTAYISMKSRKARKFLAGDPTVIIQDGKILEENMRKMRYTLDYLNQQLREKDVFEIGEVLYAMVEPNGTLTVLKKPLYRDVTPKDLQLQPTSESGLPIELIMDGKIINKNLEEHALSIEWLKGEVRKRSIKLDNIFYAVRSSNGYLYFDYYDDNIPSPVDKE